MPCRCGSSEPKIRATLTDCDPACEMPGNPGNGNTRAGGRDAALFTKAWPRAEKSVEETMPKASARECSGRRDMVRDVSSLRTRQAVFRQVVEAVGHRTRHGSVMSRSPLLALSRHPVASALHMSAIGPKQT